MSYNIEEAANHIRSIYPGMYDTREDNSLVSWYITKKKPNFGRQLNEQINLENTYLDAVQEKEDFKYTSFKAPSDSYTPEPIKNFLHTFANSFLSFPGEIATQINSAIDPELNLQRVTGEIKQAEIDISNPAGYQQKYLDSMKFVPFSGTSPMSQEDLSPSSLQRMQGSSTRGEYIATIPTLDELKQNLPLLREKKDALSRVVNREDPDPQASKGAFHYGHAYEQMYQIQNNFLNSGHGTESASKWLRDASEFVMDAWVDRDPEFQAYLQWSADVNETDPGIWTTITNPDLAFKAITGTIGSLASYATGGAASPFKFLKAVKSNMKGATSLKKLELLQESFKGNRPIFTTTMMWGGEGSEITQDISSFLMDEYEFEVPQANERTYELRGPDGKIRYMQKGIPENDAFVIAGSVTPKVLPLIVMMERLQFNSLAKGMRVDKAYTKSIVRGTVDKLLSSSGYTFQKGAAYNRTLNSIGDLTLSTTENALQEGYQAGTSFLTAEAFKQGYDIETAYGMNNLLNDMKIKGDELGWRNFLMPYGSNIPEVSGAFTTGFTGFGASGFPKAAMGRISDKRAVSRGEKAINWENLNKIAEDYQKSPDSYEVSATSNNNAVKLTNKKTGEQTVEIVPEGTAKDYKGLIDGEYDTSEGFNSITDIFDLIVDQNTAGSEAPTIQNLQKSGKLDPKTNSIHKFLLTMAKNKETGKEFTFGEKMLALYKKSSKFNLAFLNDQISQNKNNPDKKSSLERLKLQLANELKNEGVANIKAKKGDNKGMTNEGVDQAIDNYMSKSEIGSLDDIIYKHESGDLERHIANQLNKNLDLEFDIEIENAIDNQLNPQNAIDEFDLEENVNIDNKMQELSDQNQEAKNKMYLNGDKPKDINHPDAPAKSILNVLGTVYIDAMQAGKSREEAQQAIIDYVSGKSGQRMYGTNLFKVLDAIGSSYPTAKNKKEQIVNNPKKRDSYFKQIASYLSEDINPAPMKRKKKIAKKTKSKVTPVKRKAPITKKTVKGKQAALDAAKKAESAIDDKLETISQANKKKTKDKKVDKKVTKVESKPASIEDMMKDTVTEYEETVDQPVSQLSDLLSDTLEESADKGEAITFLNEKDIKESIKDLETDVQIEADNKGNVSRETSKKTKERIKRLKCSNKGV
tara:strand:- start:32129 stop:35572 length:3444 start_codon:yes stop_codon:yes gene_type:complete